MCKYLVPVIILSVLFNIPKFLEAKIIYYADYPPNMNRTLFYNNLTSEERLQYAHIEWTPYVSLAMHS